MKIIKQINIKELEGAIQLCKTEQFFRAKLMQMKGNSERQLRLSNELKILAERLRLHKQKLDKRLFTSIVDKDLEKEVRKVINKSFKGGVLK